MLDMHTTTAFIENPSTLTTEYTSGSGMFATVYDAQIPGMVIKTSRGACDNRFPLEGPDPWLYYAALCMTRQVKLPWMPNIHLLKIDRKERKFWALMEKLTPLDPDDYTDFYISGDFWPSNLQPPRSFRDDEGCSSALPEVHETAELLMNIIRQDLRKHDGISVPDFYLDAHDANWMQREDGTLVLNDPLSQPQEDWILDQVQRLARKAPDRIIIT